MIGSLGLTIAPDRVVAVRVRPTARGPRIAARLERPLADGPADGAWPALVAALGEILPELGGGAAEASVALHWSLGQAKAFAMPRLPRPELRGLLTRHVRRYFLSAAEQSFADAVQERGRPGTPARVLAAQAGTMVVEAVLAALEAVGLRCVTVTPASCARAEAARALVPASRSGTALVVAREAGWSEAIVIRDRRVLAVEAQAEIPVAELGHRAGRLAQNTLDWTPGDRPLNVLLLSETDREESAAVLAAAGFSPLSLPPELVATDPAALAALGATRARALTPRTVPERIWARDRAAERVRIAGLAAVAAILVMAAGAMHLWGLRRELAVVVEERRALAKAVGTALAIEREIEAVRSRLEAVRRVETEGTHWSRVLVSVAQTLPDSAFLTAFSADTTQLRLDGIAPAASNVASALSVSTLLRDVTLVSAFRAPGSEEVERFALTIAVQPAGTPPAGPSQEAGP